MCHVEVHVLVVELHDADETLKRLLAHCLAIGLRGLADHLHDEVTLALAVEVGLSELE